MTQRLDPGSGGGGKKKGDFMHAAQPSVQNNKTLSTVEDRHWPVFQGAAGDAAKKRVAADKLQRLKPGRQPPPPGKKKKKKSFASGINSLRSKFILFIVLCL